MKIFNITILTLIFSLQILHVAAQVGFKQKGMASYYANKFNGRKTASGEIFNNNELTGAHTKLPFNSMVKVTNVKTGKAVIVRINDRGPYAHNRVLDLSRAAAEQIGMVASGTAMIELEVIGENNIVMGDKGEYTSAKNDTTFMTGNSYSMWGSVKNPKGFGIQVGSYSDLENAKDCCKALNTQKIEDAYIQVGWSGKKVYRVLVGSFEDKEKANVYLPTVKKAGYEGFVKRHFQ